MSCGIPAPGPTEDFTLRSLAADEAGVWYHAFSTRLHPSNQADTFSEGWGDTRFAPIFLEDGKDPVHTCYMASTPEAAYMESVLHDAVLSPPGSFDTGDLQDYLLAKVAFTADPRFVSFHTPFLPKLNLERAQLIDSLPLCYEETRRWARAAFLQCPSAQAIAYGPEEMTQGAA